MLDVIDAIDIWLDLWIDWFILLGEVLVDLGLELEVWSLSSSRVSSRMIESL